MIWSSHDIPNFPQKEIAGGDQIYIIPAPEVQPWVLTSLDEKQKSSVLLVFIVIILIATIIKQPMKYININNTNRHLKHEFKHKETPPIYQILN